MGQYNLLERRVNLGNYRHTEHIFYMTSLENSIEQYQALLTVFKMLKIKKKIIHKLFNFLKQLLHTKSDEIQA